MVLTAQITPTSNDSTIHDEKKHDNHLMVKLLSKHARLPTKGSSDAAGYDLYCSEDQTVIIPARERKLIDIGIAIATPTGIPLYARIAPRSGLSLQGLDIGAGVIDSDYRGSIKVLLINNSDEPYYVKQQPEMHSSQRTTENRKRNQRIWIH